MICEVWKVGNHWNNIFSYYRESRAYITNVPKNVLYLGGKKISFHDISRENLKIWLFLLFFFLILWKSSQQIVRRKFQSSFVLNNSLFTVIIILLYNNINNSHIFLKYLKCQEFEKYSKIYFPLKSIMCYASRSTINV